MLLPYRVKVSDTKVTHFTLILALCTRLYRSHLQKPVSIKQTKHSRSQRLKIYVQNVHHSRNTCIQTTTPLRNRCRDDGVVQQPPLPQQTFFQLFHVMDPQVVDPLLKHTPDAVVHQIQIWRIKWSHLWRAKLWRLSAAW